MGQDRVKAIKAAKKLNALLRETNDLVEQIAGRSKPFAHVVKQFREEELAGRDMAEKTMREHNMKLNRIEKDLGKMDAGSMTVNDFAQFLKDMTQGQRSRQQYRSLLVDICAMACAEGWMDINLAEQTRVRPPKRRRMRLTMEGYQAIYEKAPRGSRMPWT